MEHAIHCLNPDDPGKLLKCFPVFCALRPKLDEAEFIRRVRVQTKEKYQIVYIEFNDEVVAAAGFRVAHYLAWGKVLYIDDLITRPERTRLGLGGSLMDWLIRRARELRCDEVHLDTGFQRRHAHRLYLNKGLHFDCHHLALALE